MTIINTTFHHHQAIDSVVRRWLREVYIPAARKSGLFDDVKLLRIGDDQGVSGYALQLSAKNLEAARAWFDGEAAALREIMTGRFKDRFLFFTTYLEQIDV